MNFFVVLTGPHPVSGFHRIMVKKLNHIFENDFLRNYFFVWVRIFESLGSNFEGMGVIFEGMGTSGVCELGGFGWEL